MGGEKEHGLRYDEGKNRLDLLSIPALWEVGLVSTKGCVKYADRNWEKGMSYSRTLGCALRHLFKWAAGHKWDEETGLHHLSHAAWNVMALLHFELMPERYGEFDDLPDYSGAVPNSSLGHAGSSEVVLGEAEWRKMMAKIGKFKEKERAAEEAGDE